MKTLRIWLLLLLAVLLPLRGAVAAAMLCPASGAVGQTQAQFVLHDQQVDDPVMHHDHHPHDGASDHASPATHHHADAPTHDHASGADQCNLCSAFCSVTGPVSAAMTFAEPQPVAAVFPHPHAPPPSFVSDGQERPPRST